MAQTNNPMPTLPAAPAVSKRTVAMAGLLVDVYGISELAAATETVSMLWLHHPRLRQREDMADLAARCVAATSTTSTTPGTTNATTSTHGLVVAAYDQRNHGSRLVAARGNDAWREGNTTHAQDMFGAVAGMVADQRLLLDLVDSYVHEPDTEASPTYEDAARGTLHTGLLPARVRITQHLVVGVSLGGHSAWQALFADARVAAGVVVIGCPDYMHLMADRARLSRLASSTDATDATDDRPFLGSRDFPPGLVAACCKHDPRGILFGTAAPAWPVDAAGEAALHDVLRSRLAGKKVLVCSGGADKLVPYRCTEPFMSVLERAARTWPDLDLHVTNTVYDGIGHAFSTGMVTDTVAFVRAAVSSKPKL